MNTETEIESLKKEVARLRREMDEYRQFIHYHPPGIGDDDKPQSAYLTIRCTFLTLFHPSDASKSHGQHHLRAGRGVRLAARQG